MASWAMKMMTGDVLIDVPLVVDEQDRQFAMRQQRSAMLLTVSNDRMGKVL